METDYNSRARRCTEISEACLREVREQLVGEDLGMALAVFEVLSHSLSAEVEAGKLLRNKSLSYATYE